MVRVEMTKASRWLNDFERSVTSQHGEDGIIEKVLEVTGDNNRWCVEFGSWDGIHLSNTYNLIKNKDYSAVLIEGDRNRFQDLLKTFAGDRKVAAINAFVGFEADNNLDLLLEATDIPCDFDLLSIDIDGNDYYVWECVRRYRPKVVVIEYNPTIPNSVEFVQQRDMNITQGSSIASIVKLAKLKNYELVAVTHTNAIFVDSKYFSLFGIQDNSIGLMRMDESSITYIFNGYDGTVFVRGSARLGWHGIDYRERRMQLLPKCLRKYPKNYGRGRRVLAKLYRSLYKRNII
jgi:hypothetical protein